MAAKVTFKPRSAELRLPGHNTITKDWDINVDGVTVGLIQSCIRDLYMDVSNPGYSVTVTADITGVDGNYRKNTFAMDNRNQREARENRSHYIRQAKQWVVKAIAKKSDSVTQA